MRELVDIIQPYTVLSLDIHSVMVIIHSSLDTQDYWSNMQDFIAEKYPRCRKVVLDFTLRNGIKDRFDETTISGKKFSGVHKISSTDKYIETSNKFYSRHVELIHRCSLSDFQKRFLVMRIAKYIKAIFNNNCV